MPEGNVEAKGLSLTRGSKVQLSMQAGITREDVHEAIDRVLSLAGCRTCGIASFDIHLLGGDPEVFEKFRDIKGVQDVQVVQGY